MNGMNIECFKTVKLVNVKITILRFFLLAFCYFCYSTFFSTFCTHSVVFGFIRSFCKFKIIFLSKETILQDVKWNELLSCKLRFSRYCRPYIFQSMISVRSNNLSLKYQRFAPPGCKDYRDYKYFSFCDIL